MRRDALIIIFIATLHVGVLVRSRELAINFIGNTSESLEKQTEVRRGPTVGQVQELVTKLLSSIVHNLFNVTLKTFPCGGPSMHDASFGSPRVSVRTNLRQVPPSGAILRVSSFASKTNPSACITCSNIQRVAAEQQDPGSKPRFVSDYGSGIFSVASRLAVFMRYLCSHLSTRVRITSSMAREGCGVQSVSTREQELMQQQFVAQIGRHEAALMGPISASQPLQPTSPENASATLRRQGVVRLNGVLAAETAFLARSAIVERLTAVLEEDVGGNELGNKLGDVLCRCSRYDLLLQPDGGALEAAVREALDGPLGEVMVSTLGLEAPLCEFGAVVSDYGAPRQPIHADTAYQVDVPLVSTFVALQDVSVEMGPTLFLPNSHTDEAHREFCGNEVAKGMLLQQAPIVVGTLGAGDCSVYDTRLLHAGGENSKGRRVLLYFTFANQAADRSMVNPGRSVTPEAKGYRLIDFLPERIFKS